MRAKTSLMVLTTILAVCLTLPGVHAITTLSPTTVSPTTVSPTTQSPSTVSLTTLSPTTQSPTTQSPTTLSPTTTASPTTQSPTTVSPTTLTATTWIVPSGDPIWSLGSTEPPIQSSTTPTTASTTPSSTSTSTGTTTTSTPTRTMTSTATTVPVSPTPSSTSTTVVITSTPSTTEPTTQEVTTGEPTAGSTTTVTPASSTTTAPTTTLAVTPVPGTTTPTVGSSTTTPPTVDNALAVSTTPTPTTVTADPTTTPTTASSTIIAETVAASTSTSTAILTTSTTVGTLSSTPSTPTPLGSTTQPAITTGSSTAAPETTPSNDPLYLCRRAGGCAPAPTTMAPNSTNMTSVLGSATAQSPSTTPSTTSATTPAPVTAAPYPDPLITQGLATCSGTVTVPALVTASQAGAPYIQSRTGDEEVSGCSPLGLCVPRTGATGTLQQTGTVLYPISSDVLQLTLLTHSAETVPRILCATEPADHLRTPWNVVTPTPGSTTLAHITGTLGAWADIIMPYVTSTPNEGASEFDTRHMCRSAPVRSNGPASAFWDSIGPGPSQSVFADIGLPDPSYAARHVTTLQYSYGIVNGAVYQSLERDVDTISVLDPVSGSMRDAIPGSAYCGDLQRNGSLTGDEGFGMWLRLGAIPSRRIGFPALPGPASSNHSRWAASAQYHMLVSDGASTVLNALNTAFNAACGDHDVHLESASVSSALRVAAYVPDVHETLSAVLPPGTAGNCATPQTYSAPSYTNADVKLPDWDAWQHDIANEISTICGPLSNASWTPRAMQSSHPRFWNPLLQPVAPTVYDGQTPCASKLVGPAFTADMLRSNFCPSSHIENCSPRVMSNATYTVFGDCPLPDMGLQLSAASTSYATTAPTPAVNCRLSKRFIYGDTLLYELLPGDIICIDPHGSAYSTEVPVRNGSTFLTRVVTVYTLHVPLLAPIPSSIPLPTLPNNTTSLELITPTPLEYYVDHLTCSPTHCAGRGVIDATYSVSGGTITYNSVGHANYALPYTQAFQPLNVWAPVSSPLGDCLLQDSAICPITSVSLIAPAQPTWYCRPLAAILCSQGASLYAATPDGFPLGTSIEDLTVPSQLGTCGPPSTLGTSICVLPRVPAQRRRSITDNLILGDVSSIADFTAKMYYTEVGIANAQEQTLASFGAAMAESIQQYGTAVGDLSGVVTALSNRETSSSEELGQFMIATAVAVASLARSMEHITADLSNTRVLMCLYAQQSGLSTGCSGSSTAVVTDPSTGYLATWNRVSISLILGVQPSNYSRIVGLLGSEVIHITGITRQGEYTIGFGWPDLGPLVLFGAFYNSSGMMCQYTGSEPLSFVSQHLLSAQAELASANTDLSSSQTVIAEQLDAQSQAISIFVTNTSARADAIALSAAADTALLHHIAEEISIVIDGVEHRGIDSILDGLGESLASLGGFADALADVVDGLASTVDSLLNDLFSGGFTGLPGLVHMVFIGALICLALYAGYKLFQCLPSKRQRTGAYTFPPEHVAAGSPHQDLKTHAQSPSTELSQSTPSAEAVYDMPDDTVSATYELATQPSEALIRFRASLLTNGVHSCLVYNFASTTPYSYVIEINEGVFRRAKSLPSGVHKTVDSDAVLSTLSAAAYAHNLPPGYLVHVEPREYAHAETPTHLRAYTPGRVPSEGSDSNFQVFNVRLAESVISDG